MQQTVVEKIAEAHLAEGPGRPLRAGDFVSLRPRHVMTHDNTSAVIEKFRAVGARRIHDASQPVVVLDHDIQNRSAENLAKYDAIESFAREHGIDFYPAGTGIGHQLMIERGYARSDALVVAADSHANTYGGVGALGTPVVRTDAVAIWATGRFWWQVPRTVQVELHGSLAVGTTGKDVILVLCALYHAGEVLGAAVEFTGDGVDGLSLAERLTIANMTTEWGAVCGWFPGDGLRPDPEATYHARIRLDLDRVRPHVAGPDAVRLGRPLAEVEVERIAVDKAYLVSCVNSRHEDLAAAAAVLGGGRVADGVELYVAAASSQVQREAEESGVWQTLLTAGARPLPPGCGPCIGLGAGLLRPGEVGISATNRNFKGRMGSPEARCYLASPAVVAASALAGMICGPGPVEASAVGSAFEPLAPRAADAPAEGLLPGFPRSVEGRLVLLARDDIDTDGIYGKDYTYRDDVTRERMAEVVFENYDPTLAGGFAAGDIVVAGRNFGTGSSREQAVTALQAAGVAMVVAGSFSHTYLRNAYNHGFPCVTCPELVERLRERLDAGNGENGKTIVPGDRIEVDFSDATIAYGGESFRFAPPGRIAQSLVVAGGLENQLRGLLRSD